jgi:ketosteroid isomerase-like protein
MTPAAVESVRRAERALYDAMITQDFAALQRLLDANLAYVHSTAVSENKAQYLEGVRRGDYDYSRIETPDARVRAYGDVALIDGACEMHVGRKGARKDRLRLLVVLVWRRHGDGWRLVHRHAVRSTDG